MSTPSHPIEPGAVVLARDAQQTAAVARADDFMPLLTVELAVKRKGMVNEFINKVLNEGKEAGEGDYGTMPGVKKKVLFKPGAEKLCSIFGLAPQYTEDKIVEDWNGVDHDGEPLFYYSYRCQLTRAGQFMGEAIGSCNSWESKYRYRWVPEDVARGRADFDRLPVRGGRRAIFEPDFALNKKETAGKYGKPVEYWASFEDAIASGQAKAIEKKLGPKMYQGYEMTIDEKQYRIPNPDAADIINTCQKMAQKRALVAAVLVVTNCSDAFTQDIDDFPMEGTLTAGPEQHAPAGEKKPAAAAASGNGRPAARAVPEDLAPIIARIEKNPHQFGEAAKLFEDRLVEKFGTVEGLKRYDRVSDGFYAAHPNGTSDLAELTGVIFALHSELERPVAVAAEAVE